MISQRQPNTKALEGTMDRKMTETNDSVVKSQADSLLVDEFHLPSDLQLVYLSDFESLGKKPTTPNLSWEVNGGIH